MISQALCYQQVTELNKNYANNFKSFPMRHLDHWHAFCRGGGWVPYLDIYVFSNSCTHETVTEAPPLFSWNSFSVYNTKTALKVAWAHGSLLPFECGIRKPEAPVGARSRVLASLVVLVSPGGIGPYVDIHLAGRYEVLVMCPGLP